MTTGVGRGPDSTGAAPRRRLDERLTSVLGARTARGLATLDLHTVGDLLRHVPRRYEKPGELTDLRSMTRGDHVAVMARVERATVRRTRQGKAIMEVTVTDGARRLSLTFFAKHPGALCRHEDVLRPGRVGMFTGTVGTYRGEMQLAHPAYHVVGVDADDEAEVLVEASRPVPVYPSTAAMPTWTILRAVRTVLDPLRPEDVPDPVPADLLARHRLRDLFTTWRDVHQPFGDGDWRRGQDRLRYEEALVLQAALARRRAAAAAQPAVARPGVPEASGGLLERFDARLPFVLTAGQREVGAEIAADLAAARPMQRLLQGEVGSGKTVVALRAMLQVVDSGGQAALLAPTEVLAQQHARTLRGMLGPLAEEGLLADPDGGTRVALLTGSQGAVARRQALLAAASGEAGIVVGTHALLSEQVQFADLGLVVVDEQHRFGVEQRDRLRQRSDVVPHMLVMTATPIPRTVAMTVFGDLETSTLTEVPGGRAGVATHVVAARRTPWVDRMWQRVREEIDAGHRVYVVCPRISADDTAAADEADLAEEYPATEEDGRPPLSAVLDVAVELGRHPALQGVGLGILHGRMLPAEKDEAMARFSSGDTPLLVATTVIEVGIDVPEATVMVVLDADRFGLSQLHQLRGRVGRGAAPGLCLLVSSALEGTTAATRVETLASTTDGFALATADLELRREGDVLGGLQSGRGTSLRHLQVLKHADVIARARQDAMELVAQDPTLSRWPELRDAVERLEPEREEFLDRA